MATPASSLIVRRVLVASAGNLLEWYDFAVFGIFAEEIGEAFFPKSNPHTALLESFTVFAIAFLVRPIGGVLFGHIGDRYGRERALLLTIVLMASATLIIGILPTYDSFGVACTILLVLCRLMQGLAAGGELPGALVYAIESASPRHVGFFGALVQATASGSLLASVVRSVLHATLGDKGIARWGWRVPFLLGSLIATATGFLRRNMRSTPAFASYQRKAASASAVNGTSSTAGGVASPAAPQVQRLPLAQTLLHDLPAVLRIGGASAMGMVGFYALFIWAPNFLRESRGFSLTAELNVLGMLTWAVAAVSSGALADRVGSLPNVALFGMLSTGLLAPIAFVFIEHGPMELLPLILEVLVVCHAMYVGPIQAWLVLSLRSVGNRYSGLGLAYNLCAAVLAGSTPLVATFLSGSALGAAGAGLYLSCAALVSGLTVYFSEKYYPIKVGVGCSAIIAEDASRSDATEHSTLHVEFSSPVPEVGEETSATRVGVVRHEKRQPFDAKSDELELATT